MELLYVWIEDYNNIHRQGFNFSPKHRFHFEPNEKEGSVTGGTLTHDDINTNYPDNFFGESISNITAIVGKNGSGKSSLVKALIDGRQFNKPYIFSIIKNNNTYICALNKRYKLPKTINGLKIEREDIEYTLKDWFVYHSSFFNSNRNYLFNSLDSDISTMEQVSRAFFGVDENVNEKETSIASSSVYDPKISAYMAKEMTSQIRFVADISAKDLIPFDLPHQFNLYLPTYNKNIERDIEFAIHNKNKRQQIALISILDAITNKKYELKSIDANSDTGSNDRIRILIQMYCKERKYLQNIIDDLIVSIQDKIPQYEYYEKQNNLVYHFNLNEIGNDSPFFKPKHFEIAYKSIIRDLGIRLTWRDMSDGEATFLSILSRLWEKLYEKETPRIIILDEFELGLHLQWQKEAVTKLISYFNSINFKSHHLILTTHSPILLSDLPRENIIFLDKDAEGNCEVKEPKDMERTFGANIHNLYRSSFFMQDGLMGKFAKDKIDGVIRDLRGDSEIEEKRKKEIRFIIDTIGEDVLRTGLEKLYEGRLPLTEKDKLEKEFKHLEKRKAEVEKKLNALSRK